MVSDQMQPLIVCFAIVSLVVFGLTVIACSSPPGGAPAPEPPPTVEIVDSELGLRLEIVATIQGM
jgi:hypothetical protein